MIYSKGIFLLLQKYFRLVNSCLDKKIHEVTPPDLTG